MHKRIESYRKAFLKKGKHTHILLPKIQKIINILLIFLGILNIFKCICLHLIGVLEIINIKKTKMISFPTSDYFF